MTPYEMEERIRRLEGALVKSEARVEAAEKALHHISLCSQNSTSSKEECGKIARAALETKP